MSVCTAVSTEWLRDDLCAICGHAADHHPSVDKDIAGCAYCELVLFARTAADWALSIKARVNSGGESEWLITEEEQG